MSVRVERPHFFSVKEANETLPKVKRDVKKLVEAARRYRPIRRQVERLAAKCAMNCANAEMPEFKALVRQADLLWREVRERLLGVEEHGCIVKDLVSGLVDFFAFKDNQAVFLCWKLGEDKISFWHPLDEGIAGRRAI